jgi:WD40 repeat protein
VEGWWKVATLIGHGGDVNSVAFSPDGQFLVSGDKVWEIGIWGVGKEKGAVTPEGRKDIMRPAVVSHPKWRHRKVATLRGHGGDVLSVSFSPDGKFLASGSRDETVKVWEVGSWREVATLNHKWAVNSVAFSPDGKFLASGSNDKTVKVWAVGSWHKVATLRGHGDYVYSVSFSPDGKFLASIERKKVQIWKVWKIWKVERWRKVTTLRLWNESDAMSSVSFSPDGKFLASGSNDKTVKVWAVGSWQEVATLKGHGDSVRSVSFSPDGKFLASGSEDKTVKVWEVG